MPEVPCGDHDGSRTKLVHCHRLSLALLLVGVMMVASLRFSLGISVGYTTSSLGSVIPGTIRSIDSEEKQFQPIFVLWWPSHVDEVRLVRVRLFLLHN
jgi:hypothetical protein